MTTDSTAASSVANEGVRPYVLRFDGQAVKIDVDRLRSFTIGELARLIDVVDRVDDALLAAFNCSTFSRPASDEKLAKLGVEEWTEAGKFVDELNSWASCLRDVIAHVIKEKVPQDADEAKKKYFSIIKYISSLEDDPYEILSFSAEMVGEIDALNKKKRADEFAAKREAAE